MKAEVLQQTTFAKDINGKPLVVGEEAELDPSLGNQWACMGIVRITDHGATDAAPCRAIGEPDENGHIYVEDPDLGLVRDYAAERLHRKRVAKTNQPKPKKKEEKKNVTDEGGSSEDGNGPGVDG